MPIFGGKPLPVLPPWGKWAPEVLRKEQETNPRSFALGFQMKSFTDEELTFPHFKDCFTHGVVVGDLIRRGLPCFVGVDLAGDKRPGNAITVLGLDQGNKRRYVLKVMFGAWKSPETVGHIADICNTFNVRFIMVENNAYQQSLIDWVRHSPSVYPWWMRVVEFTTGRNKANPNYGLPSLEVEFKNKAWVIPADEFEGHPPGHTCDWCIWVKQFKLYPRGSATDGVMATWFARAAIDQWGGVGALPEIEPTFNDR